MLRFEWDERKNRSNRKKHGIWFEEAQQVFDDPLGVRFSDLKHSDQEDRYWLVGHSMSDRILIVVFTQIAVDTIRIVSSRKATKREIRTYEERIST